MRVRPRLLGAGPLGFGCQAMKIWGRPLSRTRFFSSPGDFPTPDNPRQIIQQPQLFHDYGILQCICVAWCVGLGLRTQRSPRTPKNYTNRNTNLRRWTSSTQNSAERHWNNFFNNQKTLASSNDNQGLSRIITWRRERDLNPWRALALNGFQDRRIKPLCHPSACRWRDVPSGFAQVCSRLPGEQIASNGRWTKMP